MNIFLTDDLEAEDGEITLGDVVVDGDGEEGGQVYTPPAHAIDPNITSMSTLPVGSTFVLVKNKYILCLWFSC